MAAAQQASDAPEDAATPVVGSRQTLPLLPLLVAYLAVLATTLVAGAVVGLADGSDSPPVPVTLLTRRLGSAPTPEPPWRHSASG